MQAKWRVYVIIATNLIVTGLYIDGYQLSDVTGLDFGSEFVLVNRLATSRDLLTTKT